MCWWTGKHKRGKRVHNVRTDTDPMMVTFACPRCGRQTRYKVKPDPVNEGMPTDGSPSLREVA